MFRWGVNGFLLLLLFFSCGPRIKTPADTLVVGLEAIPKNPLDPRLAMADAYSSKIAGLIYGRLFRLNERLELVPDLVESFEFIPPQTYRLQLKKGILFHDGRPLTSLDVQKTIEAILDPETASPHRGTLSQIKEFVVRDPLNFEIHLKEPFAPILDALRIGILPEGSGPLGVGTGPFKVEEYLPSESLTLVRNEEYYGDPPKIRRLKFRFIPDDTVRVMELLSGRVDFLMNNIPPSLVEHLRTREGIVITTTEGINYTYLGMNLRTSPLNHRGVREAIVHAIDIPTLIRYRMAGLAQPATGILPPMHWAYEGNVFKYPFDPERARKLLDEAGYPDPDGPGPRPRFTLTYKTSTVKERIGLARLIARYLEKVGIEVHVLPYEWGTFFHDIRTGNFQLHALTWVGVTEPDIFHYAFHSSQVPPEGANRGGYSNPALDRLTEEARREFDREKRKELYSQVQQILAQELPYVSLWHETNVAAFQKNVKGVRLRPDAGFEMLTEIYKE